MDTTATLACRVRANVENDVDNPLLDDPDVRLMLRIREGDQAAFTQLVANHQLRLVRLLAHLLPHQEDAEDLAQEVFLRVYRSRHSYEPSARFSTWLFRIANNLAHNHRRDNCKRKEAVMNGGDSGLMGSRPIERFLADKSGLMPARLLDKSEVCSVVRAALSTLSETQRMAVLLHKFEDLTYSEIAVALDVTPTAIKSLLSRARDNLRQKLAPYLKVSGKN